MERRVITRVIFVVLCALMLGSLAGCGEPMLGIAGAGQDVRRGNYQKALAAYLVAAEHTRYSDVVEYNLGNVYFYLGETNRAMEMWKAAAGSSRSVVAYRARFNSGVVFYNLHRYEKAADAFLQALRIFPDRRDAKINLEYCIHHLTAEVPEPESGDKEEKKADEKTVDVLMNIVRQQEKNRWEQTQSPEPAESELRDW